MVTRLIILLLLVPLTTQAKTLLDPTRPPGYHAPIIEQDSPLVSPQSIVEWRLDTTLISPYQKIAMINGKRVKIGDKINGAKVIKIDHQSVTLLFKGKNKILKINDSFIHQIRSSSP